jgi:hypothetical protein
LRRKDGSPSRCDRQFLLLAAGAAALPAASRSASAEVYPTRPVRLIVGFRRSRIVANSPLASGLLRGIAARTPCISQNAGYESDGRQPHMNTDVVPPLAANMNAARSGRGVEPPGLRPRYFHRFRLAASSALLLQWLVCLIRSVRAIQTHLALWTHQPMSRMGAGNRNGERRVAEPKLSRPLGAGRRNGLRRRERDMAMR